MSNDDLKNRYAERLDDDEQNAENEQNDDRSMNAGDDESVENVWNAGNVKRDWKGWTVYLPEPFLEDAKDQGKLLDVRLDRDVKLDRHYKPLLIALGMERLEGMEDEEVAEFMKRMERGEVE